MPAKRIAAMELGVPAAPTGTHKLIGAIAPPFATRQRGVEDGAATPTKKTSYP